MAAVLVLTWAPGPGRAADPPPLVPCLTCPQPVPACWMLVYRWQDYNLRAGLGTHLIVTNGPPPGENQMEQARQSVLKSLPPHHTATFKGTNRVGCPDPGPSKTGR